MLLLVFVFVFNFIQIPVFCSAFYLHAYHCSFFILFTSLFHSFPSSKFSELLLSGVTSGPGAPGVKMDRVPPPGQGRHSHLELSGVSPAPPLFRGRRTDFQSTFVGEGGSR